MNIRKLENREILEGLHLAWEVFVQDVAPFYTGEGVASFQDFIRYPNIEQKVTREGLTFFGAFEETEMRGVGAVFPSGHISLLFVKREYQRRGIGKGLFMEMCAYASSVYRVRKMTVHAAPAAVDAYRHLGMHDIAPEQYAGGMRFVPMEMWIEAVPFRKKRKKGMVAAGVIGGLCFLLLLASFGAIMKEARYAAEQGGNFYDSQDGGIEDWYEDMLPEEGSGARNPDSSDSEGGISSIPAYEDKNAGYTLKEDSYTYTADELTSTTIQFEVYYPQVEGLEEKVQEKVNTALQDCALVSVEKLYLDPSQEMKEKVLGESYPVLASFVEYKVAYQSPELLSVVFQDYSYEGSQEEAYVSLRCVNVNLKDGTVYQVKDIINLDDAFIQTWAEEMRDEAGDASLLSELNEEDMKAVLGGDTKDGVYEPAFFVDQDGVEIGLSFRYSSDQKTEASYAWVTAPFDFDEILPFASDSSFWSTLKISGQS